MLKKKFYFFLPALAALLLWLGWPPFPFAVLLFVGFVPLLYLEDLLSEKKDGAGKLLGYSYLAFLLWNILSTWWLVNATIAGAFLAIFANALLMCVPFLAFHHTKKKLGRTAGYLGLAVYWVTFEYLIHRWELAWPWLSLGNGLAETTQWIQWYEYTGMFGGSLWILLMNMVIYNQLRKQGKYRGIFIENFRLNTKKAKTAAAGIGIVKAAVVFLIPFFISLYIYKSYESTGSVVNITVVQPNVDPYSEKYMLGTNVLVDNLLSQSLPHIEGTIDYLVWPETAIPSGIWIDEMGESSKIKAIRQLHEKYPGLTVISGFTALERYEREDESPSARKLPGDRGYYDVYNSAVQIDTSLNFPVYHKSKLVPGVERIPYPQVFKPLEAFAIDMGGITGSLGMQDYREVFFSHDSIGVAPVICYESVFGEYVTEYVKNGANIIFIITNDGWWGDTPGYKQHLHYGTLRAIETRRSIARSANTGISAFIDQRGEITQKTGYWVPAVIKDTLHTNDKLTFYVQYGDYIGRTAGFLSVLLLLLTFVSHKTKNFKYRG